MAFRVAPGSLRASRSLQFVGRAGGPAACPFVAPAQQQHRRPLVSHACVSRRHALLPAAPVLPLLLLGGGWLPPFTATSGAAGAGRVAASAMSTDAAGGGSSSPTGAIVVYVTVPNAEAGDSLASKLVEAKLAACVNIVPGLTSVYWWDGKVNKDPELLLIIKTREELLSQLTAFVRANHPYDEPEVVGLPILGGSPSYLKWLRESASAPTEQQQ